MDRSKKIVVGGVVATVVFVVVIVLVVRSHSNANNCVPSKDKPVMDKITVKTVGSADKTALANMAGYVFLAEDKTYLPVDADMVSVTTADKDGVQTVTLDGKCVSVSIDYKKDATGYNYNNLKMRVKNSAKKDTEKKDICSFSGAFKFNQPLANRYSCALEKDHDCVDKNKASVATLSLKSFEFELDTTADAVKARKFAKDAFGPSCDRWSA